MAAEKTEAIVLKVVEFSETSCVVTLFTRDFGKVSALAKGARRPKSPFEAALDVLSVCRVVFLRKSGDSLHLLTEAKLERRFRSANRSLDRLYAAYFVVELLLKLTEELDSQPELFELANSTIVALDNEEIDGLHLSDEVSQIVLRFQMRMLVLLGNLPSLDECVECGKNVEGKKRVPFGLNHGGVFCSSCRAGKRHVVSLSQTALSGLIRFADASDEWHTKNNDEPAPIGEMRGLADIYYTHLLGNKPKMTRFLESLASRKKRNPD